MLVQLTLKTRLALEWRLSAQVPDTSNYFITINWKVLKMDASLLDWGGVQENILVQSLWWSEEGRKFPINILELWGISARLSYTRQYAFRVFP